MLLALRTPIFAMQLGLRISNPDFGRKGDSRQDPFENERSDTDSVAPGLISLQKRFCRMYLAQGGKDR